MHKNKLLAFLFDKHYVFYRIIFVLIFILLSIHLLFFKVNITENNQDFEIADGSTLNSVIKMFYDNDLIASTWRFKTLFYITGNQNNIKKGSYRLKDGDNSVDLIRMITQGLETTHAITFVEGQTMQQIFNLIKKNPNIKQTVDEYDEEKILKLMNIEAKSLEGLVYADTYYFTKNTTDIELLKTAHSHLDKKLKLAWNHRQQNLPYNNQYEALIMASIIEKEVVFYDEASEVSGVFVNRLNMGMPLQSDPTVIYGIKKFDGNIRKKDLKKDHPHNTYTRKELPPTPICIVSYQSINAALNPAKTNALYFVSMGNHRHKFSVTLEEHNEAVNIYQRKIKKK
jgi:UPF0755 protein